MVDAGKVGQVASTVIASLGGNSPFASALGGIAKITSDLLNSKSGKVPPSATAIAAVDSFTGEPAKGLTNIS